MRRSELESTRQQDYRELVGVPVGYFGIVDDQGYPRIVPVNFVEIDKNIYFHGAVEGEKFTLSDKDLPPKATFSTDIPYAYVASHWISERYAASASQYFKSLHIRGSVSLLDDPEKKAHALQLLMEKYQPEMQFEAINADNPIYNAVLRKTAMFEIKPEETVMKVKFGQNESKKIQKMVVEGLRSRNTEIDRKTLEQMDELGILATLEE